MEKYVKKYIVMGALMALMSAPALATQPGNNGGGQGGCGVGQTTNGCGGTVGGAGGSAVQGQAQGQAQGQIQGQIQGQQQNAVQSLRNTVYGDTNSATGVGGTGGNSSARGGDQSQGQSTSINNVGNTNYPAVASTATAPSFAIGGCQWAIAGGVQAIGFGISGGGAGMYEFCKPLMKAKHFYEQGKPAVAKNLECNYSEFKEAYRMAGEPCRNDMTKAEIAQADAQATQALNVPRAAAPVGPCGPRGVANRTTQRDGSELITCN